MAPLSMWQILSIAFILDMVLGDPASLPHPIRWMGRSITTMEPHLRQFSTNQTIAGALFAGLQILGTWLIVFLGLKWVYSFTPALGSVVEAILIYYCLSIRSLAEAAIAVHRKLKKNNLSAARQKVALLVARDVDRLNWDDVTRAAVESVAENFVDGIVSPLFFAAIGGAPLALAYKMSNTLDSMVGYKNKTYEQFGKVSARIDDILNYLPARLSIPFIVITAQMLFKSGRLSLRTAWKEGHHHDSPNAGFPEAAFAGALSVRLNGPNFYNGVLTDKPYIGVQFGQVVVDDIQRACDLLILASLLWFGCVVGISAVKPLLF